MGDPGRVKMQGIPAWQQAQSTPADPSLVIEQPEKKRDLTDGTNPKQPLAKASQEDAVAATDSQNSRLEQAVKFLQDDRINKAPLEEKMAFLESKGVAKADLEKAVDLTKVEIKEPQTPSSKALSSAQPSTSARETESSNSGFQPPPLPDRSSPPIITYPEFLMNANKPPPIITLSRLLSTVYAASGTAALIYGASKYLITPMVENLTAARHEFAEHVQDHIVDLNDRLRAVTSIDPAQKHMVQTASKAMGTPYADTESSSDAESNNSDPTELFHRDYGTQTSQELLNATKDVDNEPSDTSSTADVNTVEVQATKLNRIKTLCSELNYESNSEGQTTSEISTIIKVLNEQLESLSYSSTGTYLNVMSQVYGSGDGNGKEKNDEISKMKAEIRSVKGVLLSARNFPPGISGGRRTMFPPATAS